MKKLSSLMLTTVLACGMAVPALAADTVATGNAGNNTGTVQGNTMYRTGNGAGNVRTPGMNMNGANNTGTVNGTGYRGTMNNVGTNRNNGVMNNGRGVTGYGATNNTTRAYADNDGMDWGWLGLLGLLGLAGMRNRERTRD